MIKTWGLGVEREKLNTPYCFLHTFRGRRPARENVAERRAGENGGAAGEMGKLAEGARHARGARRAKTKKDSYKIGIKFGRETRQGSYIHKANLMTLWKFAKLKGALRECPVALLCLGP